MFKQLLENFEKLQVAITFAEAGEVETALGVLQQSTLSPAVVCATSLATSKAVA
jgi:hypothetical protein